MLNILVINCVRYDTFELVDEMDEGVADFHHRSLRPSRSPDPPRLTSKTTLCPKDLFLFVPPYCIQLGSPSTPAVPMPHHHGVQFVSNEDDDDDEGTVIYSRSSSSASLRSRLVVTKVCEPKPITTTPGLLGAGETETESEDQPVCARAACISQCKSFVTRPSCGSSQQPESSPLLGL